jgi:hypothetical protein
MTGFINVFFYIHSESLKIIALSLIYLLHSSLRTCSVLVLVLLASEFFSLITS